ncbi:uncharacterized protein LOC113765061 [Coffea eugenioides]|uniref:uncharacterized protein LOC113765061 n=1 Tax=Coffea eugenioides TaxID=49369 RepID=UPI000F615D4A|nr:uncharacterized protein LOC113765061 [Coffea eugenioides]
MTARDGSNPNPSHHHLPLPSVSVDDSQQFCWRARLEVGEPSGVRETEIRSAYASFRVYLNSSPLAYQNYATDYELAFRPHNLIILSLGSLLQLFCFPQISDTFRACERVVVLPECLCWLLLLGLIEVLAGISRKRKYLAVSMFAFFRRQETTNG